ncbi:MAG: hypothetical protein ACRD0H_03615 [Actinomycetes bacterium]
MRGPRVLRTDRLTGRRAYSNDLRAPGHHLGATVGTQGVLAAVE